MLPPVLADAGLTADDVTEVVLGNCTGPGGDLARYAALQAGLGVGVPGLTVDRQCGSGLAAIVVGAALVEPGRAVIAGGVESASTSARPERAPFAPAELGDPEMGEAADLVAARAGIGRERQDAYALRSHRRAVAAAAARTIRRRARAGRRADRRRATAARDDPGAARPDAADLLRPTGPPPPAPRAGSTTGPPRWP